MTMADTQTPDALGTFTRDGDTIDVRFERFYPHPVDKVWKALIDPARLADWMGESTVEPRAGGRIQLMIGTPGVATGEIRVWEPPHVLEFTWDNWDSHGAVIRYEMQAQDGGTRLIFSHAHMPYDSSALMLPGWHALLAALGAALDGKPTGVKNWMETQDTYIAAYGLEGSRTGH
jgi:uncharacterized protein YndB with AHSA1/START domain